MKITPHRQHPLWVAFLLHRLSGLALSIFLPLHLYVLSLAMTNRAQLDGLLDWTEQPMVKAAEFGLVFLLAVHMFGGLRLLALEWLAWRDSQKTYAAVAASAAFFVAGVFLLRAVQ